MLCVQCSHSCLKFLRSLQCINVSGQRVKALGAVIRNCKHLNRIEFQRSDDSVCDLLEQVPNPSKCSLMIGGGIHLTSSGAVKLASLLPRFNTIFALELELNICHSAAMDTLATSITHKTLERLELSGISLPSAAAAALGRSLPEMLSLEELELTGVDECILQAEDMGRLFGGFNKTLPLYMLTFCNFGVRGCLAPLTKSFSFFPNLRELKLDKLNMDEHDQCGLLESFRFIRNLRALSVRAQHEGPARCYTTELQTYVSHEFVHQAYDKFSWRKQQGRAHCYSTKSNSLTVKEILSRDGIRLPPAVVAAFGRSLPEMSSLLQLKLTGVDESILQTKEMEALFGGLSKTLPLRELVFNGFSVRGCLTPLIKSLCFFPNLRKLEIPKLNMDERDQCSLLDSLRFIPNLTALSVQSRPVDHADYCSAVLRLTSNTFADRNDKSLNLDEISLTPAAAAALGQSLPEMSTLYSLAMTSAQNGSILQAVELDALFGGFNKTLPLYHLTFRGFRVEGSIASLTNSFRFFPNLMKLDLGEFDMNEHNLCCLLDGLQFLPNLQELTVRGLLLIHPHCCKVKVNTVSKCTHKSLKKMELSGISLTPAAAAALGQLLPEMLALEELVLQGVHGSILETGNLEALFGGFNKTLPLKVLDLSGFSMTGCLAPLTKSLRFLPNLLYLVVFDEGELNVDEHHLSGLLESLRFTPNLKALSVKGKPLSQAHCCTAEVNTISSISPHKTLETLNLNGISLTPGVAVALGRSLPEMLSLQVLMLTGVDGSIVQAKEMEALFAGFNKELPLYKLTFSGFSVRGCLAPLTKSFRFFPNLRELELEKLNMDEYDQCSLLDSIRFIPYLRVLNVRAEHQGPARCYTATQQEHIPLSQARCCTAEVNTISSISPHKTLETLNLNGISLTPGVAVALGRSLPEMLSLQVLMLTGVDGSIVQAKEMEALFAGFNKELPLYKLTFSGFSVRGCLAPLTKSFRFFPNLRELELEKLDMDEYDQCSLLDSIRFIPNLRVLNVRAEHQGPARCYTTGTHTDSSFLHRVHNKVNVDGICLNPPVAAALGRSLPEMSSLKELEITGVGRIFLQAEAMVALFGGFNRAVPLTKFAFSGFNVAGCLAPLNKTLRFFPNVRELKLDRLNLDEHDQCGLLENFGFIYNQTAVDIGRKDLGSFSFHFYRRELNERLDLDGISLTPAVAAMLGRLLPKMSSLTLESTGVDRSILRAEEMKALFGGINKSLVLDKLTFSGINVRSCLAPSTNMLHFFPNLRELNLLKLNMDEHDLCGLLNSHCCTAPSFPLKSLKKLNLDGISLTPAAAAALGRLLPEMSSLQELTLNGVAESILQAEEIEALFGEFNKTLPLYKLTFSGFSVTGCLAPLTRSLKFFPNLTYLNLSELNIDESDLCGLLESFQFIRDLRELDLSCNPLGHAVRCIVPHVCNLQELQLLLINETGHSEEDLNYVRDAVQQALPELRIYRDKSECVRCLVM